MKSHFRGAIAFIAIPVAGIAYAHAASFDCTKARTGV